MWFRLKFTRRLSRIKQPVTVGQALQVHEPIVPHQAPKNHQALPNSIFLTHYRPRALPSLVHRVRMTSVSWKVFLISVAHLYLMCLTLNQGYIYFIIIICKMTQQLSSLLIRMSCHRSVHE